MSLICAYTQKCWYERLGGDHQFNNKELAIGQAKERPPPEGKNHTEDQAILQREGVHRNGDPLPHSRSCP